MEKLSGVWLDFERVDDRFASYGLYEAPLKFKGQRIPFKAVIKEIKEQPKVISIVSRGYKLLPNAMVDEAVRQLSDMFGLDIMKRSGHRWVHGGRTVYDYDKDSFRAYWTMTFPERYKIVSKDWVQLGVQVRNSEDGSMGFGVDLFTFRLICSNGAIAKTGDLEIQTYWKHTKHLELDINALKTTIIQIIDKGKAILDNYKAMTALKLNEEIAERLAERLPKKYLPEYIKAVEHKIEILKPATLWDVYDSVTRAVWHSETASMFTKRNLNAELHKILQVAIVK
jgi:hypothetical protein